MAQNTELTTPPSPIELAQLTQECQGALSPETLMILRRALFELDKYRSIPSHAIGMIMDEHEKGSVA